MRLRPFLLVLVAVLLATPTLVAADRPGLDPTRIPAMPSQPPPPLVAGPQAPDPAQARSPVQQVQAVAGWQMLSFPVSRVEAVSGLSRMLLRRGPTGLEAIDPVNHPEQVDPGLAYLAFFDQPGIVEFAGPSNDGSYRATPLYAGWNMIGCPSSHPVRRETLTVTRPGGTTARPSDVASPDTAPGRAWLYSTGYGFVDGQWRQGDMRSPGTLIQPGQVAVLFCWTELELNWNLVPPPGGVPVLRSATPPTAAPGQAVSVAGSNLGEHGWGTLSLAGLPIQPEDILSWTPTRIQFRVPPGARPGALQVMVDRYPGNSLALAAPKAQPAATAAPPPSVASTPAQTGSLVGQVVSSDGSPLRGAQIALDDGQQTVTDSRGAFRLDDLPAGRMKAYITLLGYKSASGQVEVAPGVSRTLQVSLSPTAGDEGGARSQEQTGRFTVTAYPFAVGLEQANRYWVYRIEVWEYGNYRCRWENTWWTDVGDASFDLNCPGAPLGRSYAVVVTWRNKAGDERSFRWTPEIHYDGETVRYYNPLGSSG